MIDTAVQGPGPVLVPGEGTAGLVPVPAKERNCAIFVKKRRQLGNSTEHLLLPLLN